MFDDLGAARALAHVGTMQIRLRIDQKRSRNPEALGGVDYVKARILSASACLHDASDTW
jgi:hypothetical protein